MADQLAYPHNGDFRTFDRPMTSSCVSDPRSMRASVTRWWNSRSFLVTQTPCGSRRR